MTLGIFETNHAGHFLVFVGYLAEYAVRCGARPNILLPEAILGTPQFDTLIERHPRRRDFNVVPLPDAQLATAGSTARSLGSQVLVVPHADVHLRQLALASVRGIAVTALVISDPVWELRSEVPLSLGRRAILHSKRVAMFMARARMTGKLLTLGPPTQASTSDPLVAPDPVVISPGTHVARTNPNRFVFTIAGSADTRKNPLLVASSVRRLLAEGYDAALRIAGPICEPLRAALEEILPPPRLQIVGRTVTPREFDQEIAGSGAVVCAYNTHAPNSTVAKAAALGVPIVAAGSSTYRQTVSDVAGVPTAPLAEGALTQLMRRALEGGLVPSRKPVLGADAFCRALLDGAI